jgi:hypothetical protein
MALGRVSATRNLPALLQQTGNASQAPPTRSAGHDEGGEEVEIASVV